MKDTSAYPAPPPEFRHLFIFNFVCFIHHIRLQASRSARAAARAPVASALLGASRGRRSQSALSLSLSTLSLSLSTYTHICVYIYIYIYVHLFTYCCLDILRSEGSRDDSKVALEVRARAQPDARALRFQRIEHTQSTYSESMGLIIQSLGLGGEPYSIQGKSTPYKFRFCLSQTL